MLDYLDKLFPDKCADLKDTEKEKYAENGKPYGTIDINDQEKYVRGADGKLKYKYMLINYVNNNNMKISDQGEVASIKNLQDHHTKEIFRLQAEHNLKITDMMQQHTKEISHLQSQLMISKRATEQCKYELKRNEEILLHEKKRLDSILMKNDNNDDKIEEL